eukprot:746115-Hanusia_phi.AAC.4
MSSFCVRLRAVRSDDRAVPLLSPRDSGFLVDLFESLVCRRPEMGPRLSGSTGTENEISEEEADRNDLWSSSSSWVAG